VKYAATTLTVDNLTPPALWNSTCGSPFPDGGLPLCSGCEPPTYSGFQANDGAGHEVYVEQIFFNTDHLQSSPECISQPGMIPVTVGMTFTSVQGILDFDPYGQVQFIAPMLDSDYVIADGGVADGGVADGGVADGGSTDAGSVDGGP
jgi:hypothetical protein